MHKIYFIIILIISAISSSVYAEFDQSIILVNGKIYTVNEEQPLVEAISIKRGKIDEIGSNEKILKKARAGTQVIDLKGRTIVPGFIDSHGDMNALGNKLSKLDLQGLGSYEEVVQAVSQKALPLKAGTWVIGHGWDNRLWDEKVFPTHNVLTKAVPDNPVVLFHADGNTCLVNAKAMELAGLTFETLNPDGGIVLKVENQKIVTRFDDDDEPKISPSGILIGEAMKLVTSTMPEPTERQAMIALRKAAQHCAQRGITSVHDMGMTPETIVTYKRLIDETKFYFRIYGFLDANSITTPEEFTALLAEKPLIGYGQDCLTVRGVHLDVDGQLSDHTAALFEDYVDTMGGATAFTNASLEEPREAITKGSLDVPLAMLTSFTSLALDAGYQVSADASGDLATNAALTAYSVALKNTRDKDHRLRIEGVDVIRPNDVLWMAELKVVASIQPNIAISDMGILQARLGAERLSTTHTWRTFLENEVRITGGSAFPEGDASPLETFYFAITRQDIQSRPTAGWIPEQRLTRDEALKSLTLDGAYASFSDDVIGSIQVGKWADLVMLSEDIMTIPANDILTTEVLATMVGGSITYMSPSYKN